MARYKPNIAKSKELEAGSAIDDAAKNAIGYLQIIVCVMCGGGLLGRLAAEQPADFYIDSRVGRLPFSKRDIRKTVEALAALALGQGLDPHHMPPIPGFHMLTWPSAEADGPEGERGTGQG